MKEYIKHFQYEIKNTVNLKTNIKKYFETYNFKLEKEDENQIIFIKKWSFFSGYTLNPFNLKTKIDINIHESKSISINYQVTSDGFGFITPIAFSSFYECFLSNLKLFLSTKKSYVTKNELLIKSAKKKMLFYIGLMLVGTSVSFFLGHRLSNLSGNKLLYYFGFIIGVKITTVLINKYLIKTNTLKKQ